MVLPCHGLWDSDPTGLLEWLYFLHVCSSGEELVFSFVLPRQNGLWEDGLPARGGLGKCVGFVGPGLHAFRYGLANSHADIEEP